METNHSGLRFYMDESGRPYEEGENPFPRTPKDDAFDAYLIKKFHLYEDDEDLARLLKQLGMEDEEKYQELLKELNVEKIEAEVEAEMKAAKHSLSE